MMLPGIKNPSRDTEFTPPPHHPPQPQRRSGRYLFRTSQQTGLEDGILTTRTVQITLAGLCDAAATLLLVLLEDVDLLQGLHDLAVDAAAAGDVVRGARATVLGDTVHLPQTADTDGLAEVDMAGNRGGADVEPVDVLGRELLADTSLDGVNPAYVRNSTVSHAITRGRTERQRNQRK